MSLSIQPKTNILAEDPPKSFVGAGNNDNPGQVPEQNGQDNTATTNTAAITASELLVEQTIEDNL